jgi:hypothetical protein
MFSISQASLFVCLHVHFVREDESQECNIKVNRVEEENVMARFNGMFCKIPRDPHIERDTSAPGQVRLSQVLP